MQLQRFTRTCCTSLLSQHSIFSLKVISLFDVRGRCFLISTLMLVNLMRRMKFDCFYQTNRTLKTRHTRVRILFSQNETLFTKLGFKRWEYKYAKSPICENFSSFFSVSIFDKFYILKSVVTFNSDFIIFWLVHSSNNKMHT